MDRSFIANLWVRKIKDGTKELSDVPNGLVDIVRAIVEHEEQSEPNEND